LTSSSSATQSRCLRRPQGRATRPRTGHLPVEPARLESTLRHRGCRSEPARGAQRPAGERRRPRCRSRRGGDRRPAPRARCHPRAERHFKKSLGHSSPARRQRYDLIQTLHHEQPRMNLSQACQALGVSRSGYHAHLRKHQRPRRRQDARLAGEIRAAFTASRHTYGSPRLVHCLRTRPPARQEPHRQDHARAGPPRAPEAPLRATHHHCRQGLASGSQPPAQRPAPSAPTKSGSPTSPICRLAKAGSISPPRWTSAAAASSAGARTRPRHRTAQCKLWNAPCKRVAQPPKACCTTATVAANTPAPSSASASNCAASLQA
jgi:hypothetical protein